jgi:hypothetical protein
MVRLRIPKTTVTDEDKARVYSIFSFFGVSTFDKVTFPFAFAEGPRRVYSVLCMHFLAELGPNCHPPIINHTNFKLKLALSTANCVLDFCFFLRSQTLLGHPFRFKQRGLAKSLQVAANISPALSMDPAAHRDHPSMQATDPAKKRNIVIVGSSFCPYLLIKHLPLLQPDVSWHNPASVCLSARDVRETGLAKTYLPR